MAPYQPLRGLLIYWSLSIAMIGALVILSLHEPGPTGRAAGIDVVSRPVVVSGKPAQRVYLNLHIVNVGKDARWFGVMAARVVPTGKKEHNVSTELQSSLASEIADYKKGRPDVSGTPAPGEFDLTQGDTLYTTIPQDRPMLLSPEFLQEIRSGKFAIYFAADFLLRNKNGEYPLDFCAKVFDDENLHGALKCE